ncbi:hypothetical protein UCRPC4_g01862 [Phaeomoniella chlamydospora]|uniref:Uncharacterized protein n=1 Tax=Phaeomoniella chlamydospora TaxID=158046 RepID=A0A0G2GPS5_PHACM|nr:hypothetical protein UCRPC4_g01862 [Phaeomoniella chlamydospora]
MTRGVHYWDELRGPAKDTRPGDTYSEDNEEPPSPAPGMAALLRAAHQTSTTERIFTGLSSPTGFDSHFAPESQQWADSSSFPSYGALDMPTPYNFQQLAFFDIPVATSWDFGDLADWRLNNYFSDAQQPTSALPIIDEQPGSTYPMQG